MDAASDRPGQHFGHGRKLTLCLERFFRSSRTALERCGDEVRFPATSRYGPYQFLIGCIGWQVFRMPQEFEGGPAVIGIDE